MGTKTLTSIDFMTGILAGLALRHEYVIDLSNNRFDQAIASAYEELLKRAGHLDVDFQIIPDRMHGDSPVAQDAITTAIESRLAGRINPQFRRIRVTIDDDWANSLLERELPGGKDMYLDVTDAFLRPYKGYAAVPS
jgi:hypothetical protein